MKIDSRSPVSWTPAPSALTSSREPAPVAIAQASETAREPAPTTDASREARLASTSASDHAAFLRIERANELAESGGLGAIDSRLVTTAGRGSPASIGRSQLLVSLQTTFLGELAKTPRGRATLERHGVSVEDLRAIDRRGDAAVRWYDGVVRGRAGGALPLSRAEIRELRAAIASGDTDAVVARFGARFEADTGLPASELLAMADTRLLTDPATGARFRALRARSSSDAAALDALVAERPELARVRARIDDDRSTAFFLRRPKRNGEHRAAWYTRAARTEVDAYARVTDGLRSGLDAITSRMHSLRTFGIARRLLDSMPDVGSLDAGRRASLLGRMQRLVNGNPAFFREHFGTPSAPRVSSVDAIETKLRSFAAAPATTSEGDQGRSLLAFERRYEQVGQAGQVDERP